MVQGWVVRVACWLLLVMLHGQHVYSDGEAGGAGLFHEHATLTSPAAGTQGARPGGAHASPLGARAAPVPTGCELKLGLAR